MIGMEILQPAVVLMIWTMVMWAWMYATRIPAMQKAQVDVDRLVSDPDASLDRQLNAATDRIALGQRLLMERIVEMSAEDRAAFADRLEEGVQRMAEGKPPRKYDRD